MPLTVEEIARIAEEFKDSADHEPDVLVPGRKRQSDRALLDRYGIAVLAQQKEMYSTSTGLPLSQNTVLARKAILERFDILRTLANTAAYVVRWASSEDYCPGCGVLQLTGAAHAATCRLDQLRIALSATEVAT
jgi:hypothetical protein